MTLDRAPNQFSLFGKQASSWIRLAKQLAGYGVFGGLGALSDFLAYTALVRVIDMAPLAANILSVPIGILVSFVLNSRFTFKRNDRTLVRAVRFFTVGLTGLALSTALLALLTNEGGIDAVLAKMVTVPPVVAFQFLSNKYWTFREIS